MALHSTQRNGLGPLRDAKDLWQVSRLPLFSGLPPETTDSLLAEAYVRCVERNAVLFVQGEQASHFYVILDGWVKLHRNALDGGESVIGVFAAGEPIAEAAIFASERYPVSATVIADSRLLVIPGEHFVDRLRANPELGLNMLASISCRLRVLVRQLEHLSTRSSVERLAEFLLQLCPDTDGRPATSVRLPLDKYLIAARLGMQPETLSRALGRLREIGVTSQGDQVLIGDRAALKRVVNGSAAQR